MPIIDKKPKGLKPFISHGMDVSFRDGDSQGWADCPFCTRENKWSANIATGQWECKGCLACGNVVSFLQRLWEESETTLDELEELSEERYPITTKTLYAWGVRRSLISAEWILPGWGVSGKMNQLYRYVEIYAKKRIMIPTPVVSSEQEHGIFGLKLFDRKKKGPVSICEGPWDGMTWYQAVGRKSNVVAVPGCNVFLASWVKAFDGYDVQVMYHNDHPRVDPKVGKVHAPAAYRGVQEVVSTLTSFGRSIESIQWLNWGGEGKDHDPSLKHGYDIRDHLSVDDVATERKVGEIKALLSAVPKQWESNVKDKSIPCNSWEELISVWSKALRLRQEMRDVLVVMLAVAASTDAPSDQLFLQVIGDAGSGKTRFCDAMLTSGHCYPLEHLTGFHSGWKDKEGKDYSLISRVNGKTMITPEGDTLLSSPNFQEIMSQQRRIFDGTSGASYKNQVEDKRYTGLRTPWIMVGTPVLMTSDQSRLGDRFLRVFIDSPDDEEKRKIVQMAGRNHLNSLGVGTKSESNGEYKTQGKASVFLAHAFKLTGGYINYLRDNVTDLLARLNVNPDLLISQCATLAEFTADLRAKADPNAKKDADRELIATKELPTRLIQQLVRLACHVAVVLGRDHVDDEVMRIVRKVAVDTSRGRTLSIVRTLHKLRDTGATTTWLVTHLGETEAPVRDVLRFMRRIGVVRSFLRKPKNGTRQSSRWKLTDRMQTLCDEVLNSGQ